MDKRIIYRRADGGCSVVTPAPHGRRFIQTGSVPAVKAIPLPANTGLPYERRADGQLWLTYQSGVCLPPKATPEDIAAIVAAGLAESDDTFLARLLTTLPADAKDVHVVDASEIPIDRTFRNAWRNNGKGKPEVDMPAARELWRDRMRAARAPKLAALDVEYQRADEATDAAKKAEVVKRKQTLRDAPADPRIEAAKTPAELKAVWPAELD